MARRPDPEIMKVLKEFGFGNEALWDCHGTWVIYHHVLEKIAAKGNIRFQPPQVLEANGKDKSVAFVVFAQIGDHEEWSTGEAAPANNKNAYPWAMAEKRAKDRVILKLIGLHGLAYSEEEADDFKQRVEEEADHRTPDAILNDFLDRVRDIPEGVRADFEYAWKQEQTDLKRIQRQSPEIYNKFTSELHVILRDRRLDQQGGSDNAPQPASKQEPSAGGGDKQQDIEARSQKYADEMIAAMGGVSVGEIQKLLQEQGVTNIDGPTWYLAGKSKMEALRKHAPAQFHRVQETYTAITTKEFAA